MNPRGSRAPSDSLVPVLNNVAVCLMKKERGDETEGNVGGRSRSNLGSERKSRAAGWEEREIQSVWRKTGMGEGNQMRGEEGK